MAGGLARKAGHGFVERAGCHKARLPSLEEAIWMGPQPQKSLTMTARRAHAAYEANLRAPSDSAHKDFALNFSILAVQATLSAKVHIF